MNKKLLPIIFSIFFIVSCGGGGGGGGSTPTTPAPTVNLSAEPTSVLLESTSTLIWSSTNATSCSASWTTQTGTSGSEAVTITAAGNNSFSITCTGDGGSRSASVTVEGYRNTDGVVVDGYISGAEVCIDENENWTCDSSENSTTSDNEGKFTIRYANGNLVSIGGTDLDSQTLLDNLLITHKLIGHSDFKAVTPVTSVAAFMEDSSLVNAALGIDASINVFTFDPVANKGDGGINDYLYEKGNQLTVLAFALQNITNDLNTTTETTQDYFKAITEEIEKEYTETETKVDIETETFITNVIENVIETKSVTIDETAKANTTKALAGILPVIEVKSSDDLTTAVIRFAVSTLQTDIQAIANGTATAETVSSYTEDVLAYIAEDQNIDADEITPDISAIADSATTSEDTAIEINILLNDSYLTSAPVSVSAGNGSNGTTSLASNIVTYDPDSDYNGTDTFSYTITQGDKTSSADVTVTIEAVNDAPTIDIASTIQVAENQIAVTTVSTSDVDEDELTLTLGGNDVSSFNLSSDNVLTFKEAPDYETKTSYSITLTLTDGTDTVTKDITIAIANVNDVAPEFTSEATFSAAENQTAIGTVTATDAEGDSITFTVSGSELEITSAGVLTFKTAPDYETKTSYTATVTASDGTNSTTQDITVNITDVNEAPAFTSNATFSAAENQTAIGTVAATDVDGDTITYSISGSDITINSSSGVIAFTSAPDYETKTSYTATVTASDGINSITQDIAVNVTNVNDIAPVFTSNATFSVAENQTAIGTVAATDAEGDVVTFTVSGSELAITPEGVLTFTSAPDYETKTTYTAIVTASDGTNSTTKDITVNVTNVNDNTPLFTSNANFSASENQTEIGTVTATDADGDGILYTISGSDITINSSSGVIAFTSAPDYETKTTYTATVTASDGLNSTTQDITVNVTNENDNSPSFTSEATFSAAENQTAIGTVMASDADGDDISYSISGSDITINSSTGVIAFASAPDYETTAVYTATVTASDGINSSSQIIEILVSNICEFDFIFYENQTVESRGEDWRSNYRYRDDMSSHSRYVRIFSANSPGDTACPQPEIFDFTIEGPDADFFELSSLEGNDYDRYYIYSTRDFDYENPLDADANNIYEYHLVGEYGGEIHKEVLTLEIKNENEYGNIESISFDQSNENIQIAFTTNHDLPSNTAYIEFGVRGPSAPLRFLSGKIPYDSSQSNYNIEFSYGDQLGTDNISPELWGGYYQINKITFYDQNEDEIESIFASRISGDVTTYVTVDSGKNFVKVKSLSGELTVEDEIGFTGTRFTGLMEFENYGWVDSNSSRAAGTGFYPSLMLIAGSAPKGLNDYSGSWSFGNESNSDNGDGTFTSRINSTDLDFYTRSGKHEYRLSIRQRGYNGSNYYIYLYPQELLKFGYVDSYTTFVNNKATSEDLTGPALTYYSNLEVESCTFDNSKVYADIAMDVGYSQSTTSNPRADLTLGSSDDLYYMYSRGVQYNNGQTLRDEIQTEFTGKTREDFEVELYAVAAYDKALNYNRLEKNSNYHKAPEVRKVNLLDHCDERIITNNAPVITSDAIFAAAENQRSVGSVTVDDVDGDDITYTIAHNYSQIGGGTLPRLTISQDGIISFDDTVNSTVYPPPDFERYNTYNATVTVSDGIFSDSQNITINISDINEAPTFKLDSECIQWSVGGANGCGPSAVPLFSVEENKTSIGDVQAYDDDGDSLVYSISGTDAALINIDSSTGVLSFTSAPDYETKSSYSAIVTANDGSLTGSLDITVNVTDVNEAPAFTSNATFSAAENQTAIDTVTATDADGDDVTFTVSGSELAITSAGVLSFASAPNYETKTSYTATVTASDGTNSTTQAITVNVTDVNEAPTFTSSATFSAAENQTAIGTVAVSDVDGDTITYSISGSDITINSSNGVIAFASAPNYETKTSYTATVTASDGTNSTTQSITVNVTDVNEAPAFTSSATFSAAENQTAIDTVTATDADGDSVTFTVSGSELEITSAGVLTFASAPDYETKTSYTATVTASDGTNSTTQSITVNVTDVNDNSPVFTSSATFSAAENQTAIDTVTATDADGNSVTFTVSGSELEITSAGVLTFASAPDYETKTSYTATVTASDGTNSTTQSITVNVTDVNDNSPVFTSSATFSAAENQTAIDTVTATDADGNSVTFTVSGSELEITSAGVLTFASAPDYETKTSYTATVTASDGTNSTTQSITVNVTDVNDNSPVFTSSATFSAAENQTAIDTVTATDADGNSVTFTVSGSELEITSAGVLTFASAPDYETKTSYTATVTASDGTNSTTQSITVNVTDVNDNSPVFTSSATFSAAENQTAIDTVTATDADGNSVTFTVSGSELEITSAGVLTFASAPDYETKTSYTATVTASDGTNSTTQSITVNVTDVNDNSPVFTSSATFSAAENQTAIDTVTATDADGDSVTFTVSGSELEITSAGVLTFASAPDYETKSSYSATVTASDGTNSTTQAITINVTNVNDNSPSFTSEATFSADENQTAIGTVAASDADGDTITYSISGSDITINSSTGVIAFASAPDYETKTSYTATVTASDGTNSTTQNITVNVTNVNDNSPSFTSSATFSAAENQTAIGTVAASDADGDTITYSVSGTDSGSVSINSSSGVLTFNSAPNYESKTSYSIVVTASDGTNSTNQNVTITITNVNEAPAFTSSASFSAAENQTTIGSVSVTDPENATLSYSLSGTDAGSLAVSSSGVLSFGSAPNYESKNSYSATVAASDGTNSTTQDVTISVTDVNDAPVATAAGYIMNLKPQDQTSGSLTLAGTDEDGDTLTYSIVSNGSYGTASLSGTTVTYQTAADTQSAQTESFTFKVNDGTVDSSAATISISLKTDPLYQYQWHLNNTGQTNFASNTGTSGADLNVDTVIASNVYGTGVNIGIIDGGIELDHEDLSSNVLANASWDYVDADRNPVPVGNDSHGTAIAGITSATAWNNLGGRGIAPESKFASYNMLDSSSQTSDLIDAVGAGDGSKADNSNIDIYNMSFGVTFPTAYESILSGDLLAAFDNGINNLRSGKGAIYIKSGGNYYSYIESGSDVYCGPNSQASDLMTCHDSSHNTYGASPHFITVPAITAKDGASIYASAGSNAWVSAYGGEYGTTHPAIMSSDLATCSKGSVRTGNASSNAFNNQGNHSENTSCNYTAKMNGSSSAAPMVAGVVALMLEKEPNLTWRDVKHILATTADVIDSSQSVTHLGITQHDWRTNAAGHEFHNWYGFGKVNAQAAVNAADSYNIGSLGTLCTITGTTGVIDQTIPDSTSTSAINISSSSPCGSGVIEFVKVKMYYSHAAPNTVGMRLQSPSNTIANIITPFSKITTNPNEVEFNIGVSSFYGESMTGNWTIAIDDYVSGTTGNLRGWTIEIYGH